MVSFLTAGEHSRHEILCLPEHDYCVDCRSILGPNFQAPPLDMPVFETPLPFDVPEFLERLRLPRDLGPLLHRCIAQRKSSSLRLFRQTLAAHCLNLSRKYGVERPLEEIAFFAANGEVALPPSSHLEHLANQLQCAICKPFRKTAVQDSALIGTRLLYELSNQLGMNRRETYQVEKKLIQLQDQPALSAMNPQTKVRALLAIHVELTRNLSHRRAAKMVHLQPSAYLRFRRSVQTFSPGAAS